MIRRAARNRLTWLVGIPAAAVALYLAFAVFGVQALFIDREVNEAFVAGSGTTGQSQERPPENTAMEDTAMEDEASGETTTVGAAEPDRSAGTEPASPESVRVTSGSFHSVNDYEGSGDATIYRLEDGSHVLRLENLDVDNGPDLYVYAVAAGDANDDETVLEAGFLNLGQLKGNRGNQTYPLPESFDPEVHRAVSVWCQRFSANFATAPLG